jgi:hypothetical protein
MGYRDQCGGMVSGPSKNPNLSLTAYQLMEGGMHWVGPLQGADDKLGQTLRTHLKL